MISLASDLNIVVNADINGIVTSIISENEQAIICFASFNSDVISCLKLEDVQINFYSCELIQIKIEYMNNSFLSRTQ